MEAGVMEWGVTGFGAVNGHQVGVVKQASLAYRGASIVTPVYTRNVTYGAPNAYGFYRRK